MARKWLIRKGDLVTVLTGSYKGKMGEVLKVLRQEDRVLVKGVNMIAKHQKQTAKSEGGIIRQEAPIHISNVAHIDPKTQKPTRVGVKVEGNKKVIYAKRSGALIERAKV